MKPILLWPTQLPRSAIEQDIGVAADQFMVLDVDEHRTAHRLYGLAGDILVLDPYHLSNSGPMGAQIRARFRNIVSGRSACRDAAASHVTDDPSAGPCTVCAVPAPFVQEWGGHLCEACRPALKHTVRNWIDQSTLPAVSVATCQCGWEHRRPWPDRGGKREAATLAHWREVIASEPRAARRSA